MRAVVQTIEKLLDRDVPVLITGESGTGKSWIAELIHAGGPRASAPLVTIDCATIPHDLFESELFGYERGTFTDATARKLGRLETAGRGTVHFDEIAALTPPLQAKLLRVLEERSFTRLGGSQSVPFSARVLASSSAPLTDMVAAGTFRRDLFYRINVVTLALPPLRERPEDIPSLARRFLRENARPGLRDFDREVLNRLAAHPWPGNVRELKNVIQRATLLEESDCITLASIALDTFRHPEEVLQAATAGRWTLEELERRYIEAVLRQTAGNYSKAAAILGINRKTLLEKRKKYGMGG